MILKSIKAQLIAITMIPVLLTLVFISVLVLQEFNNKLVSEDQLRANDIATQASMMSEFFLYAGDTDRLDEVSKSLIRIDDLHYIRFISNNGQLLIQKGFSQGEKTRHYVFPIYPTQINLDDFSDEEHSNIEQLGIIELGLSEATAFDRHYKTYQRLFFIAFMTLALGVLLILFFTRIINKAIDNLTSSAKAISKGISSTRCEENGTGELLDFQKTFNKMAESFEASEIKLKAEVEAATASLLLTIDELSHKNDELDKSRRETIALERTQAISDERTRIMKDMHDGIGGQLVASLALLEQEKDSELKDNISDILTECLDDLRLIINSLNIANDALDALLADFKYRMSRKLDQMGITLTWRVANIAENIHLAPQTSLHLLRILQESFTNILKHAKATEIVFEVTETDTGIKFSIIDNGSFDPEQVNTNGIGMTSMRGRAKAVDAELQIKQAYTGGCQVILSVPEHSYQQE